jgi:hypothetical protein
MAAAIYSGTVGKPMWRPALARPGEQERQAEHYQLVTHYGPDLPGRPRRRSGSF